MSPGQVFFSVNYRIVAIHGGEKTRQPILFALGVVPSTAATTQPKQTTEPQQGKYRQEEKHNKSKTNRSRKIHAQKKKPQKQPPKKKKKPQKAPMISPTPVRR
jgi:hypothetical protein